MLLFSILAGCGETASTPPASPMAPAGEITADDVLQRHLDESNQCNLLVADNYLLEWEAITTDGKSATQQEKIIQQGRQGLSFTRMQQQLVPQLRFSGFGLSADGTWWSAGDLGVQARLPEEIVKPLSVYLDPTPVCAFQARWPERTYVGEEDWNGQHTHHIRAVWADGTPTDLWFDTGTGLLAGSSTSVGNTTNTMKMTKYILFNGIQWPSEVFSTRVDGDLHLLVAEKLQKLEVAPAGFRDIGHQEVAALLADRAKQAAGQGSK